jgi:anti-anti-sigma factor
VTWRTSAPRFLHRFREDTDSVSGPMTSNSMVITTHRPDTGTVRVAVAGEVDLATAPQLRLAVMAAIDGSDGCEQIEVDLTRTTFLDARGVGVLLETHTAAELAGIGLVVHNPRGIVRRILAVLDVADILGVVPQQARPWADPLR